MKNIETLTRTPPISRFNLIHHPLDVLKKSINPANINPKQLADAATLSFFQVTIPFDLAALGYALASKLKADRRNFVKGLLGATTGFITGTTALSLLVNPRVTQAIIENAGVSKADTGVHTNSQNPNLKTTPNTCKEPQNEEEKKLIDDLRRYKNDYSNEQPASILHSAGKDPRVSSKWRKGFFAMFYTRLQLLTNGSLIPTEYQVEVNEFMKHFTSQEFINQDLVTKDDVDWANRLLDKLLGKYLGC